MYVCVLMGNKFDCKINYVPSDDLQRENRPVSPGRDYDCTGCLPPGRRSLNLKKMSVTYCYNNGHVTRYSTTQSCCEYF